jgi:hypothetical protein
MIRNTPHHEAAAALTRDFFVSTIGLGNGRAGEDEREVIF